MIGPENSTRHIGRRRILQLGLAGLCALAPAPVLAAVPKERPRSLSLYNLHTSEKLKATYWADGDYIAEELSAIDHLLRDFRSGEVARIDVNLLDLLNSLHERMDSAEPFNVISGYRSPKTNAALAQAGRGVAKRSLHMQGMAIDIRLPGRRLRQLHGAAKDLRGGGVGYYPGPDFVHLDVGRVRYW